MIHYYEYQQDLIRETRGKLSYFTDSDLRKNLQKLKMTNFKRKSILKQFNDIKDL